MVDGSPPRWLRHRAGEKDFWCLTSISMVQAARIFNDSGDNLFPIFRKLMRNLARKVLANPVEGVLQKLYQHRTGHGALTVLWVQAVLIIVQILSIPALVVVLIAGILYVVGPVACIVLSLWRLRQHDYGDTTKDGKANLVPALIIFYCLVICQGVLFFLWWCIDFAAIWVVVSLREDCMLPEKWGSVTIVDYLYDTRAKCWQDPTSIDGRNLIHYAVDLVDSELQKEYLSGARMLDNFIKLEADVRSLLLPSRTKIQKLIDTPGWRSSNRELRAVAARIVAYLAGDIHLSQFPGATQCISSLLDTALPYWNNTQEPNHHLLFSKSEKNTGGAKGRLISRIKGIEKRRTNNVPNQGADIQQDVVDSTTHGGKRDGCNELILQGLAILQRLAFDQQNCSDICRTPGLLPKIMAPLYSETLIQDTNANQWADVVNGSLKVVHRLIRSPEWIGRSDLVHKICSNEHALSNLERILYQGKNDGTELQMRAIEILTELVTDSSANLSTETKENLIKKQLQIFLTSDEREEEKLRVTAGKALALLSRRKSISKFIMKEKNNIVEHLNGILDATNNITYRTVAVLLLENLCTHCTLDKDHVKEALQPKVLREVLSSTQDLPKEQRNNSAREENQATSGPGHDEENQATSGPGHDEENQLLPEANGQINSPDQANEELKAKMEFREALLSLTFVMCDKLITADDFDDVVRNSNIGEVKFVAKLQAIVQENRDARADCLRIVKFCGQIVVLMLERGQVTARLKLCVESLRETSEIMSDLESCMLFAGTDCGVKKTARPLLSDLVEKARKLLGY
ncbi:uncharacterized protein LOC125539707 [Triticum urartu]|uniref:uncharacterized protein LOC125539707 n=1 Tax=Triticum urartu TaxID=4572 RepID=UPI002043E99C|nr:uncharacterized protein LOC125539707 [Triticum urartu]